MMSPNNNKNRDARNYTSYNRPHGNHNNAKRTFFSLRPDRTTSYYDDDEFEVVGAAEGRRRSTGLFGIIDNSPINNIITTNKPSPRSSISTPTSMMPLFSDNLVSNSKEIQTNIFMPSSQGTTTNNTADMSDDDDDVAFDCCDTDDVNYGRINRSVKTMLPYLPMFDDDEESFCSDECDENEDENQNQNQNKFIGGNDANVGSGIRVSSYLSQPPPGVVVVLDGSPLFPYQDADTNEENHYKMSINSMNNNNLTDDDNKSSNNIRSRHAINRTLSFDDVDFDDVDCDCDYDDDDDEEDDIQHQEECGLSFSIPITGTSSGGRNHSNFLYHVS
jgi:hypothetical protein